MELYSIASGSSGNCIYIGSGKTKVLIDTGISGKRIEQGLNEVGLSTADMDAVLLTHEHADHISGLGVITRKYGLPVYSTKGTVQAVLGCGKIGKLDESLFHEIDYDQDFMIGDLSIHPFQISHDAAQPVAFVAKSDDKSVAVATDMGKYDEYTVQNLSGLDALLIEANHDVNMLQVGSYPYYLKQRILGDRGHLSNEVSGQLLSRVLHDGLKKIFLGHLSQENNYAELAYETVRTEITMSDTPYKGNDFPMVVARRDCPSEILRI